MKIKFCRGYRGRATDEKFYDMGMIGEFTEENAATIIAEGAGTAAPAGAKVTGPDPLADLSGGQLRAMVEKQARDRARNATARRWKQHAP
jgi:hypothetical protein